MPKKIKCPRCSSGWCKNHILQILPIKSSECYYRNKTKLRLCPKYIKQTNTFERIIPIVNTDHKFYTPCFILEEQQLYYTQNNDKLLNMHKLKLESQSNKEILIAKHGRKKNYCSVCKGDYEDYLEHINEEKHRLNLRANRFSKLIVQTAYYLNFKKQLSHKKQSEILLQNKMEYETKQIDKEQKLPPPVVFQILEQHQQQPQEQLQDQHQEQHGQELQQQEHLEQVLQQE